MACVGCRGPVTVSREDWRRVNRDALTASRLGERVRELEAKLADLTGRIRSGLMVTRGEHGEVEPRAPALTPAATLEPPADAAAGFYADTLAVIAAGDAAGRGAPMGRGEMIARARAALTRYPAWRSS